MKIRLAILVSVFLLLLPLAAGCGEEGGGTSVPSAQTDASQSGVTTTAEETADPYADELPSFDFEGEEFHFYTRHMDSFHGEFIVAEETGDVLNDAIYNRNLAVEERLKVTLAETTENGNTTAARTAVLAGEDTYDVITTRCVYAYNYAEEGLVIPVEDVPYIDLSKGYWDSNVTEAMSVLGHRYFTAGDFSLTSFDFTHLLIFNKKLADDYGVGNLYQTVSDGKWTYDAFNEAVSDVTHDLNGDGKMDANDGYGFLSSAKQIPPCFWISAGLTSVQKDADDKPVFNMPSDEKFFTVMEKIYNITWDNNAWMVSTSGNNVDPAFITQFQANLALFMDMTCYYIDQFRAMDADFGIIPFPKWNEAQDEYYSRIEGCDLFCIPVTNKNLELTGAVLEAMASESHAVVLPAYYDITLRTKITRDEESEAMLDLIFSNRVFDWGDTIWCPDIRDGIFDDMFKENDRDFASKMATLDSTVQALIAKTVEAFEKLN